MPMDASTLDRQIDLSHRVLTRNAQGEQVPSWQAPYATVWAEKIEISGREFFQAGAILAENTVRFRIRWRTDVLISDQVNFEGTAYNIRAKTEIGRHEGIELFCSALVP